MLYMCKDNYAKQKSLLRIVQNTRTCIKHKHFITIKNPQTRRSGNVRKKEAFKI